MLTPSQNDVIALLVQGFTNSEIAEKLELKVGTVKCHLFQAYKRLGVKCDREVIAKFYTNEIMLYPSDVSETNEPMEEEEND